MIHSWHVDTLRTHPAPARPPLTVKQRIVVGSILWTLLVTVLHLWANVGLDSVGSSVRQLMGIERSSLRVGFLPVT